MDKTTELTLVDLCYQQLKEHIISGKLAPGEKLQIEKLKSLLKTGPTPIREALSRLTSSGLIEAKANRGFFVKKISEAEIRDIYDTFNQIELLALDRAMEQGDAIWEGNILAHLHRLALIETSSLPIDQHAWLQLNYEFHLSLVSACNSPCLLKIRQELYQLFDRYCHLSLVTNQYSLMLNHRDHCDIAQAVIARNKTQAAALITKHFQNSLDDVIDKLKSLRTI